MMKSKKLLAIVVAMTMVAGSSLVAYAENPTTGSGNIEGEGASEGHVEKKLMAVTLPTDATATTFAYTMDPEGLVQETAHEAYGDNVIFPAKATDKHVYFNNGPKGGEDTDPDKDKTVYANESKELKVINKSSQEIELSVTAEAIATEDGNDIPLVKQADLEDAEAASLFLGLVVGSGTAKEVLSDTAATLTATINGTEDNFKIAAKPKEGGGFEGYEYRALTLAEYKALDGNSSKTQDDYDATWANTTFKMVGETTTDLDIADDTTAPTLKLTWTWNDPNAGPSLTTTTATAKSGQAAEITFSGTAANISDILLGTSSVKAKFTITDGKITCLTSWTDGWTAGLSREFTVKFDNDATATFTITKE